MKTKSYSVYLPQQRRTPPHVRNSQCRTIRLKDGKARVCNRARNNPCLRCVADDNNYRLEA